MCQNEHHIKMNLKTGNRGLEKMSVIQLDYLLALELLTIVKISCSSSVSAKNDLTNDEPGLERQRSSIRSKWYKNRT